MTTDSQLLGHTMRLSCILPEVEVPEKQEVFVSPSSKKVNGPLIRELREKRGWERSEFAALIGVSKNRVYKIEKLEQATRLITLRRIAAILGVEPGELLRAEAPADVSEQAAS